MTEPMRATSTRDEDLINYQPMAVLAVIAIIVSGLFMVLATILTIVGLITRHAVLEPWLIAIAVIGVLLAIAARWQIRLSEGTRAGAKLAGFAWWLAVVGGCVYAAYYVGSVMSIQAQARKFVHEVWLKALVDNKPDDAFFFTMDPLQRKGMNARDIRGRFGDVVTPFRSHSMVRMLARANGKVAIEPRGILKWQSTVEGLEATTQFVIRTPEGEFDFMIPVLGSDHRNLEGRQWQVKHQKIAMRPLGFSSFGRTMISLEQDSNEFLREWIAGKLQDFRHGDMYLDTEPLSREERRRKYRAFEVRVVLGNSFTSIAEPARGLGAGCILAGQLCAGPVYADLYFLREATNTRKLIEWDESKQKQPDNAKEIWRYMILSPRSIELRQAPGAESLPTIEIKDNEIRATIEINVLLPPAANVAPYRCRGTVTAVLTDPKWLSKISGYTKAEWKGKPEIDSSPQTLTHYDWRISSIVIDLARDTMDERPGGGPNMMPLPNGQQPK